MLVFGMDQEHTVLYFVRLFIQIYSQENVKFEFEKYQYLLNFTLVNAAEEWKISYCSITMPTFK